MKIDVKLEPDVIGLLHEVNRQATIRERDGKRQIKEAARMRELGLALTAKFRRLKERMDRNGR